MTIAKKMIVTVLFCCTAAAGLSYYTHKSQTHTTASLMDITSVRSDSFAERVGQHVARVARVTGNHSRTVIFDNDAATDDALALIIIGNDPGVVLKAITVAGTGEAHGRQGAENMAAIANMLGKPNVPVAYGHSRPLSSAGNPFPIFVREAMDKLLEGTGVKVHPDAHLTDNAVGLIKQVVENSPDKVTILATGPLTNIAEFITQYPQLKKKIDRIVVMGGAVHVPGNVNKVMSASSNRVSEWNFYADPEAAHRVFAAKIPLTLVALDATNQVPMTKSFYDAIANEDQPDLRLAHVLLKNLVSRFGMETFKNDIYMWDGLAAMVMLDPEIADTIPMTLNVDKTNGQVMVADNTHHAALIDVVTKIHNPDAALSNYVAIVKSNHIYAQRRFHNHVDRVTAYLGKSVTNFARAGVQGW